MPKTKIADLSPNELRVYAEIVYASENGVCTMPMTSMRYRCGLSSVYQYKKYLKSLEQKGLISQRIIGQGIPREITILFKDR